MTTKQISISAQPVTLAEAKARLRIDLSDEDDLIAALIAVASDTASQMTGRSIAAASYQLKLDAFPAEIRLLWPPIVSVTSVEYVDAAGDVVTMPANDYGVDMHSEPGWILPAAEWPATYDTYNAVTVSYTAGYGAGCPEAIKQWILLQVGHWYKNREAATDKALIATPYADVLLDKFKVY